MSGTDGFSADWLAQREPFDTLARNAAVERMRAITRLNVLRPPPGAPWRVIDLACGTGANLRWLAPRMGGAQQWLVVDHDAALLRCWPEKLGVDGRAFHQPMAFSGPGFHASVVRQQTDLAQHLETLPWHAAHLVTASALLDLVSTDWLQRMIALAVDARAAMLFTLSVDGRHVWTSSDPQDATVGRLFRAHQRRDKGFGPALGADAIAALRRALRGTGYRVFTAPSDWVLEGRDQSPSTALQRALIEGMAAAACEQSPASRATVEAWRVRRLACAVNGQLRVGHQDVLAVPPDTSSHHSS